MRRLFAGVATQPDPPVGSNLDYWQNSFQEFKTKLLEAGLVDHIVVSNKSVAKIYVKGSYHHRGAGEDHVFFRWPGVDHDDEGKTLLATIKNGGQYKYYFIIGSIESFEEKLEEAQKALNIDPHDYIPVLEVATR
ncbi:hypothetical protein PIB30_008253 [Stylosanthes scabra]|uniref:Peptidase M41 FtsH extracellular domain-containing protein n=1 Tax=Stylosanthes scabra TaxID=79078 RepID=A0ABU6R6M1_9FABA|nr:hypothetical protein [Stylosanthes scabra]